MAGLVADPDWRTRGAVAAQPDVPAAAAVTLVADKAWQVRYALAENPHTDPAVWRAIVNAPQVNIRQMFAQNRWLPEDIAQLLVSDPAKDVRARLAAHTAHRPVLDQLLRDQHHDVRAAALRNPLATDEDVLAAVHDRHLVVRAQAVRDPRLPKAEVERLRTDRSEWVRDQANRAWTARSPGGPPAQPEAEPELAAIMTALSALPEAIATLGDALSEDLRPTLTPPDLTDPQALASWPETPAKPRTKWLTMFSWWRVNEDDIPDHVAWFWRYSERIDRDPAWQAWWSPAEPKRLDISLQPGRWLRYEIEQRRGTLHVNGHFPDAEAVFDTLGPQAWLELPTADHVAILMPGLEHTLALVAKICGLPTPPPLPPHEISLNT